MLMSDIKYSDAEIRALLKRHEIKPTSQRVDIARLLLQRQTHLSAEDIYNLVNPDKPGARPVRQRPARQRVSKATVYNTLGLFAEKGLVREVIADPHKIFYDPNTTPHHHFYDVTTGALTDIDAGAVEVSGLPPLPEGTSLEGVEVVVRLRQRS